MTRYVLDTDSLSLLQRGHATVSERARAHQAGELATTVITVEEQLTGWYTMVRRAKGRDRIADLYQRLADQVQFLAHWTILPFTVAAIIRFEELLHLKLNVGRNDLRIAAIALENAAAVVTRNVRDFERVPGLTIEDWSA